MRHLVCVLILGLLAALRAGAQDQSTPEATVRSFLAAIETADVKQASNCVKGAVPISPSDLHDVAESLENQEPRFAVGGVTSTLNAGGAVVSGEFSLRDRRLRKPLIFRADLSLVSTDGVWQLVPQVPQPGLGQDWVNGMIGMFTDLAVWNRVRDRGRAVECVANIKQIGAAALKLAQNSKSKLNTTTTSFHKDLAPYIINEAVYRCPADRSSLASDSYSFNAKLAGINVNQLHAPAVTIMVYEGKNGKLDFRHAGKAGVCFADGHAMLVDPAAAKALHWTP